MCGIPAPWHWSRKYSCVNLKNRSSVDSENRQMRIRADDTSVDDMGDLIKMLLASNPGVVTSSSDSFVEKLNYGPFRKKIS